MVGETAAQLERLRARMVDAALRVGRSPSEVRLLAISKKQPLAKIRQAYAAGQRDFGENYAQELADKAEQLADLPDLRWHFVGHLQRNKAKLVAPRCAVIHTVDSLSLAQTLTRQAGGARLRCLVEVNLGGEGQKGGIAPTEVGALCKELVQLDGLSLEGLMCLPPVSSEPRPYFRALRELRDALEERLALPLPELSMGMSADFEIAIEEGATWVRLGTALFGERAA